MVTPLEKPWPKNLDYSKQSIEVPGSRRPGQTGIYRNGVWGFLKLEHQDLVRTLPDLFEFGLNLSRNDNFLGHRPIVSKNPLKFADHYVWQTYAEVDERRRNLGSAVHKLFTEGVLGGGEYQTAGIWSQNRPEWQIIDTALQGYGKVGVSLYDTLGKDSVGKINHSHLTIVFATSQHIPTLLTLAPRAKMLKMIVCIDEISEETKSVLTSWGKVVGIDVKALEELEELGKANRVDPLPASPEQIATICYTSGTTNNPKGAMLTHRHLTTAALGNLFGTAFGEKGLLMSYLPLAHIYERINELNIMAVGGAIGYFTGDPLRLLEDAAILKPNFFPSVPRVLNRVYQSAMLAGQVPGLKGVLFRSAVETKLKRLHETGINTHAFWDRLVFKKVQTVLGGNVQLITCGSAPISAEAMDFLKIAFACEVIEGYGMTENCGTCTRCWPNDPSSSGTIGVPQPIVEMKLVDVPHMNYTANDKPNPRGEICVRGDNCFIAYYKDEKNTRETLDEEGWLHTGDVGEIDSCGRFKIIDRIKNIMKLSQGEYVALEKIENVYSTNPYIAQLYVHGDSLRDHLVGIVVPDQAQLAVLVNKLGGKVTADDISALLKAIQDPRVTEIVLEEMAKDAKKAGLKGFEMIKKIHLTLEPFTPDNGLLTPTLKIRRRDCQIKFKKEIDALYAQPSAAKL